MTITVTYRFTRDQTSVAGLRSTQRVGTDAINALEQWKAGGTMRDFEILDEEHETDEDDGALIARLTTTQTDVDANRGMMDPLCNRYGVKRTVV